MRRRLIVLLAITLAASTGSGLARATEPADELAKPFVSSKTPPNAPSVQECTVGPTTAANVNLDCDDPFPNNEPNIVVDPGDPQHAIVSSNDYGSCCDEYYTTFDGGRTWVTGNMSTRGPNITGSDPITVIDPVHGTAVHFSLNYHVSSGIPAVNGDVVASVSTDGQFSYPVVTPDGAVHVAFQNGQHEAAWEPAEQFESQYLVVTSTNGGSTFGAAGARRRPGGRLP
jgi:hypothetical protein